MSWLTVMHLTVCLFGFNKKNTLNLSQQDMPSVKEQKLMVLGQFANFIVTLIIRQLEAQNICPL